MKSKKEANLEFRQLGTSSLQVSPVALGCWPISGMTSLDVTDADSRATIHAARDTGINFFDTAHCYGSDGQSERLLGQLLNKQRDRYVIATKGGIHWAPDGTRVLDASPKRLRQECELSLQRLRTDCLDLLYLHAPDGHTPIGESASALCRLQKEGKTRFVGVSNVTLAQLQDFHSACAVTAVQPAYNMLIRHIEKDLIPWCQTQQIAVVPYWPLMKGLLAGKLPRDHQFRPGDGRAKYQAFQGSEWQKNQDLLDELRELAEEAGQSVAELVVNWTLHQAGITSVLCGAKRADQIRETSAAMHRSLSDEQRHRIDQALLRRGTAMEDKAV